MQQYEQFYDILPYLQAPREGLAIENELERLQSEAVDDPVRKKQLAAIRYYLRYLITRFEQEWENVHHGATNYRPLLDQLRRSHGKATVCIVTFNYDRMIEQALLSVDIKIDALSDYIQNPTFKLFKLHGSINWVRTVAEPMAAVNRNRNEKEVIGESIRSAAHIKLSDDIRMCNICPAGKIQDTPIWPAIAIPVTSKLIFECPKEHVEALTGLLPETERIITIGWRGAESHFLKILADALAHKELPMLPIAADGAGAQQVVDRFRDAGIRVGVFDAQEGFTNTIVARTIENFCKQ